MLESLTPPEVPLHREVPQASIPADRYAMATRQALLSFVRHALDMEPAASRASETSGAAVQAR